MAEKMNGTAKEEAEPFKEAACGLVMPISGIDGCSSDHWTEVKAIITESVEAIKSYNFTVKLVSEADDVGVIQKQIVQNIYNSDIVICDVSCKNPNVMFELGMRLAFDKPTIIIKDDKTDYSFDTSIIEHLPYPRDLRFSKMVSFKDRLAEKVVGTMKASAENPDHSTFLKNFGKFHVASLTQDVIPTDKYIVEMLTDMQRDISRLRIDSRAATARPRREFEGKPIRGGLRIAAELAKYIAETPGADMGVLRDDDKFISNMVQRCEAPVFFPHRMDFVKAVKQAIDELYVPAEGDRQKNIDLV